MKKLFFLIALFLLITILVSSILYAGARKRIEINKFWATIHDSGDQSEAASPGHYGKSYYWNFRSWRIILRTAGYYIGCKDWTDEFGNQHTVKLTGAGHANSNEEETTMAVPDEENITIKKYWRYQPPEIVVDDFILHPPLLDGDEVNPDYIPGTADVMLESFINTDMGVTIRQRVFAWSQTHHDDYFINEWTMTNTGNVDLDDEIELPNQTLNDLYFLRLTRFRNRERPTWNNYYGEHPEDSLKMVVCYPRRSRGSDFDNYGGPLPTGWLQAPCWLAEAYFHASHSATGYTDDPIQPQMTGQTDTESRFIRVTPLEMSESEILQNYELMRTGFLNYQGTPEQTENVPPGTHHSVDMDELGFKYVKDVPWFTAGEILSVVSFGPYTLKPGESVKIVYADGCGTITPEQGWDIGTAWQNGTCTWDGPNNLPAPFQAFPDLYDNDNDYAKDCWVSTGKDSLYNNIWNAQWNFLNDYNVPTPPPPPSLYVTAFPDKISLEWGNESEAVSDFAGYKVYRAVGSQFYSAEGGTEVGKWERIFECGEGTANPLTHTFDDATAQRGQAYFYYVTAFDNGVQNGPDARSPGGGEVLESGMYLNMTSFGAHLTRPAGTLESAVVVPNPFHINAKELQFLGEPDKILFMNLPPVCTIKIYTESGDLIKTIEHTDGSGDEPWGILIEEHSTTESDQIIVSGIYIAQIETPTGESTLLKFLVVR